MSWNQMNWGSGLAQTMMFGQQVGFQNDLMNAYRQQQYVPCPHPNCPMCEEARLVAENKIMDEKAIKLHKKELYEERCAEYVVSWRKRFHKNPL